MEKEVTRMERGQEVYLEDREGEYLFRDGRQLEKKGYTTELGVVGSCLPEATITRPENVADAEGVASEVYKAG